MPHILVKLYSGRTEQQKQRLAEELTRAAMAVLKLDNDAFSVAVEDIAPEDWTEKVYKPDILGNPARVLKKPGYTP